MGDDADPYVQRPQAKTGRFGLAPMILVYGIFATIIGLMDVVTYIGLDEATYVDLVNQMSEISGIDAWTIMPAWTPDMALLMTLSMACLTVSGVLAVACFAMCRKGENWKVSIMLCAASTVMCLGICAFTMFASLGIPLFANIHLCGSVLTEVFFCMTISKILYGHLPSIGTMILFCALLGIFAIGAPGVPGGTVMASLGLITGVLMFDDAGTALMLAIFALQDSFGTACNVTGDGALTLMLTGYAEKHGIQNNDNIQSPIL